MAITSSPGSYQDFGYTGGVQAFAVPQSGVYQLQCWGAGGKNPTQIGKDWSPANAAPGGYSIGYANLPAGTVLYVVCGGSSNDGQPRETGGYNGGAQMINADNNPGQGNRSGGGGGATHIATRSGTLAELGSAAGLLIAAGGGGGAGGSVQSFANNEVYGGRYSAGAGGGLSGEDCKGTTGGFDLSAGTAGTQTWGAAFGRGGGARSEPGGDYKSGGGGGGYWGGMSTSISGGAGGSGYIGGVPAITGASGTTYAPATQTGAGSAADTPGWARITYMETDRLPVVYNGTQLTALIYNGVTVTSLIYNGTRLFAGRALRQIRRMRQSVRQRMRAACPRADGA